jgi:hypothetical protein
VLGVDPSLRETLAAIRVGATGFVPDGRGPRIVLQRVREALRRLGLRQALNRFREPEAPVVRPEAPGPPVSWDSSTRWPRPDRRIRV